MDMKIRNVLVALAFVSCAVQAQPVVEMTISDVDGDGLAGCFRFESLDPDTCMFANQFSSDGSVIGELIGPNATIPGASTDGAILFGETQGVDDFSLGFYFSGFSMKPITLDVPEGEIKRGVFTLSNFPVAMRYNWDSPSTLPVHPDPGTLSVQLTKKNRDNSYNYFMTWSHRITQADDPTGAFVGNRMLLRMEGVVRTCASQGVDASCSRAPKLQ